MKILEKGKIPEGPLYRIRCGRCQTLFEFAKSEAVQSGPTPPNSEFLSIACPLCQTFCGVSQHQVVK